MNVGDDGIDKGARPRCPSLGDLPMWCRWRGGGAGDSAKSSARRARDLLLSMERALYPMGSKARPDTSRVACPTSRDGTVRVNALSVHCWCAGCGPVQGESCEGLRDSCQVFQWTCECTMPSRSALPPYQSEVWRGGYSMRRRCDH